MLSVARGAGLTDPFFSCNFTNGEETPREGHLVFVWVAALANSCFIACGSAIRGMTPGQVKHMAFASTSLHVLSQRRRRRRSLSVLVFLTRRIIVFPWSAVFSFGCCCWKILGLTKPNRRWCEHPPPSWSDKQFSIHFCQKRLPMQGIYFLLSVRWSIDFSNAVGKCCLSFREKQNL